MSKQAAEQHRKAAEHHEHADRHRKDGGIASRSREPREGSPPCTLGAWASSQAMHHAAEVAKYHIEHHGNRK